MIEYLSYSSISKYLNCPENWRRHYIAKEPTRSSPALVFGSSIHGTIEAYIADKSRSLPQLWDQTWAAKLESEKNVDWGAERPEEHHAEGVRILADKGVMGLLNSITPLSDSAGLFMERKVSLNVPGVAVPIIGYIDIVTADGIPGDFKTSASAWTDTKAKEELQPLFYLAALNQAGMTVPRLTFRHYIITKAKKPQVQIIEHRHTWDEIFWLFNLIQSVWKGIQSEVFPLNPSSWLCSPKYCSFYSNCRGKGL